MSFGEINPIFLYFFSLRNINLNEFLKIQEEFHLKLEETLGASTLKLFSIYAGKAISKQQINYEGNSESFTFAHGTKMPI
jgi:hypothetical protein